MGRVATRTVEERFWEKVDKRGPDDCWEWMAAKFWDGYGEFRIDGSMRRANRVSYEWHNGQISDGMHVLHTCDTRACVNPAHLWVGTNQENVDDKMEKGRHNSSPGERNGRAKLTREQVIKIRAEYETGRFLQRELGEKYGVSLATVNRVVNLKHWGHV